MNTKSTWRNLRRGIAAVAAAAIATVGLALPANAADEVNPGTIDTSKTANLHIHKFEQPTAAGTEANGLPQDTTGLKPLEGIKFQVQQINGVDLKTNEGWATAAAHVNDITWALGNAGPVVKDGVTNASGDLDLNELPLGLYVVSELLTAEQLADGITGTAPFIVALPLTNPESPNAWLYDVHVYPKNNVDTITKTVDDTNATKIGDSVKWTIQGSIPAGNVTKKYTITDQLDSRLTYNSVAVSITPAEAGAVAEGTDYTVTHEAGKVTIDFTEAGRQKLNEIKQTNPTAKVQVVLDTTVNSIGTDGIIPNHAVLFPNDSNTEGIPSNVPVTKWGGLDILKLDATDKTKKLAGAEFKVYATENDAKSGANPIAINGKDTWGTNDQGVVTIDSLRLSNFADGAEITDESLWQYYWVVEAKAPDGYELQAAPFKVSVTDNDRKTVELTVNDVPHNDGFKLPLTGGIGTWLFIAGGAGLLLLAAGIYVRSRRQNA